MPVSNNAKEYIFPRVPLDLTIPEAFPEIEEVSNVSVVPEISSFSYKGGEIELTGLYYINLTYQPKKETADNIEKTLNHSEDDFFSQLKIKPNGLFEEEPEEIKEDLGEPKLHTITFSNPLHTFVSLDSLGNPSYFRPLIVVENLEIKNQKGRSVKGELVLGLVNKMKKLYK